MANQEPNQTRNPILTKRADWIHVPQENILCIEHPAKINNIDKAVQTLGSLGQISKCFDKDDTFKLGLRFRTSDIMAPPIEARPTVTKDILVRVTIPKTKNGNNFQKPLEKLRSANGRFKIDVVSLVDQTVRFRDMTDFQWNSTNSKFVHTVKNTLLPLDLKTIKEFTISPESSSTISMDLPRPPQLTHTNMPHSYGTDESNGKPFLFNYSRGQPTKTLYGDWDIDTVPTEPEPTGSTTSQTAECVELLRKIFEERPICTRRVIRNLIPERLHYATKYALPQVSYYWRLGPWRDTCIRFGVDPRKSIEYAKYQVIAFKIEAVKSSKAWKHNRSHIFDGKEVVQDGRIYQFCDIIDPLLAGLVKTDGPHMRTELDRIDGWYQNNRMFKIKHITRKKLDAILKNESTKDSDFVEILKQPDTISDWRDKYKNRDADDIVSDDVRLHQEVEDAEAEEGYESELSNEEDITTKDVEKITNPVQLRDDKVRSLMKDYMQTEQGSNDNDEVDYSGDDDDDYELLDDS